METTPASRTPSGSGAGLRVVFAGMRGAFSLGALAALLDARVEVRAVLVAAEADEAPRMSGTGAKGTTTDPPGLPAIWPETPRPVRGATLPLLAPHREPSIVTRAWERGIGVLAIARERDPSVRAALAALAPDVVCVACWPRRVPAALLDVPRHGWLNLHPSLLPAHRGPEPLFWTLRAGDATAGVTVHQMDATLDGGDILAQETVPLPDGIAGAALEGRCAKVGGELLARALAELSAGTAQPRRVDPAAGSYEPMPGPDDFLVTPNRSARWAFNFIRGAAYWGGPIEIVVADQRLVVAEALDYISDAQAATAEGADAALARPVRVAGDELWLRCAPGVLHVRLAS